MFSFLFFALIQCRFYRCFQAKCCDRGVCHCYADAAWMARLCESFVRLCSRSGRITAAKSYWYLAANTHVHTFTLISLHHTLLSLNNSLDIFTQPFIMFGPQLALWLLFVPTTSQAGGSWIHKSLLYARNPPKSTR